jgi:uncharacterized protein YuzE
MGLRARVVERSGKLPKIAYRWDPETDILTGSIKAAAKPTDAEGLTGSVELEGADGSFILLDVQGGAIRGVEVVVWPDVRTVQSLQGPAAAREGEVVLPQQKSASGVDAVEVDTSLTIETNPSESVFRVRLGPARRVETVRVADGLLVEVDEKGEFAGLWLTEVPPFPVDEPA